MKQIFLTMLLMLTSQMAFSQQPSRRMTAQDSLIVGLQKLNKSADPDDVVKLRREILKYANSGKEVDLAFAVRIAGTVNKSDMADSLNNVAIKRYPNGTAARTKGYNELNLMKAKAAEKVKIYEKWLVKFPEPTGGTDIVYDYARSVLAMTFAEEGDEKNCSFWVEKIRSQSYKAIVESASSKIFLTAGNLVVAEAMMRKGLDNAKLSLANNQNPGAKRDYYEYMKSLAVLLHQKGNNKESLDFINEVYINTPQKAPALIELYSKILVANQKGKEALPLLNNLVKEGKGNVEVIDLLKQAYIQSNGGEAGYVEFFAAAEMEMKAKIKENLGKSIVTEPAPNFELLNMKGKKVSLSGLKGKIVILDFWATWCAPCKKSFPAMQTAVNKYKDDPKVEFLFIDTWERVANPEASVKAFITENKYTFNVLFDDKKTKVVDSYKVSGIPAKFVIDGNGNIRFKMAGFDGSDAAAVEEISNMIEMLKK